MGVQLKDVGMGELRLPGALAGRPCRAWRASQVQLHHPFNTDLATPSSLVSTPPCLSLCRSLRGCSFMASTYLITVLLQHALSHNTLPRGKRGALIGPPCLGAGVKSQHASLGITQSGVNAKCSGAGDSEYHQPETLKLGVSSWIACDDGL